MSEYKFYKNKRTRFHPSLEIESNSKERKNMEMTSSLTNSGRYIRLKKNPGPSNKQAYIRKYIRCDSIKTRGQLLKKYNLSEEDLIEIVNFLANSRNKKVSAKPTKLGFIG